MQLVRHSHQFCRPCGSALPPSFATCLCPPGTRLPRSRNFRRPDSRGFPSAPQSGSCCTASPTPNCSVSVDLSEPSALPSTSRWPLCPPSFAHSSPWTRQAPFSAASVSVRHLLQSPLKWVVSLRRCSPLLRRFGAHSQVEHSFTRRQRDRSRLAAAGSEQTIQRPDRLRRNFQNLAPFSS